MTDLVILPDGRRAQYWQGGATAGPAVFFHHGCPDSRLQAASGHAAARRAGVRLVAVNRPGYGRSDLAASDHLSVAADTVAVADALGIDRFAVLGMSIGGPYALACAARYPQRVAAAGVVAAPGPPPLLDPPRHRDDLSPQQREFFTRAAAGPVGAAVELFRPDFEAYRAGLAADAAHQGGHAGHSDQADVDAALSRRLAAQLDPRDAAATAELPAAQVAAAAREALAGDGYLRDAAVTLRRWAFDPAAVRCPTTLWYGAHDANAPERNGRWLADRIPGAVLVVRPDTAHLGTLVGYWDEILDRLASGGPMSPPAR